MRTYLVKEDYNGQVQTLWTTTRKSDAEKHFNISRKSMKKIDGLDVDRMGYCKSVSIYGTVTELWIEITE